MCKRFEDTARKPYRRNKMSLNLPQSLLSTTFVFALALALSGKRVEASGVFELEFVRLHQLDSLSTTSTVSQQQTVSIENSDPSASAPGTAPNKTSSPTQNQQQTNISPTANNLSEDPANFVRVLVCLKEAFTSQLDGPCTFGNASITLDRDTIQTADSRPYKTNLLAESRVEQAKNMHNLSLVAAQNQPSVLQQQQGSQLTNVVRILFTFRWTKSFTIILTAEHPQIDADDQHISVANRDTLGRTIRRAGGGNPVDLSTNPTNIGRSSIKDLEASVRRSNFIDRHVLTENEVLPNLEQNPNKPWASRFSRSLKSSIAYRFRVYCSLNYYGDGCTTFCRARDDQFGHYNCSSTGQKVCLDGWLGPDCDKAMCRSGCNQQHGYCEKPETCQCRPGWTGLRCDECITYPGCQSGYCLSPWQCICQQNWGGVLCDLNLNYCGTHEPCKNNSTCQNIAPGKYKCHCPDGFTGVDCDVDLSLLPASSSMNQLSAGCAINPCLNGGTCFGFNSFMANSNSEIENGQFIPTEDGSQELTERFYHRCQCPPGFYGDYCQWADLAPLSITNLLLNTTAEERNVTSTSTNTSNSAQIEAIVPFLSDDLSNETQKSVSFEKNPTFVGAFNENQPHQHHVNLRHLISGVVIASVVGVFLAALLLAWCCLIAIERNKVPFIQMNIVRASDGEQVVSSLRRMHAKIRDSLRRSSRGRIKPETKLSIENVLKPPPTYEESSSYHHINNISLGYSRDIKPELYCKDEEEEDQEEMTGKEMVAREDLVKRGALEQKLSANTSISSPKSSESLEEQRNQFITRAHINCPRHGHLYRHQIDGDLRDEITIDVIHNPVTISMRQQQPIYRSHSHQTHHLHQPPENQSQPSDRLDLTNSPV